MRIVDLSLTIETNKRMGIKIKYQGHRFGRFAILVLFGLTKKYLRSGLGWATELITFYTNSSTHLESPWHYAPTTDGGKPSPTIDQIPLEWCFQNGVKLDVSHRQDGEEITREDIQTALAKIPYTLKPMDIVLIQTGNDRYAGTEEYYTKGSGMGAPATRYLLDCGIKILGIDSCVWDLPLPQMAAMAKAAGRNNVFWEAHYTGLDTEWWCLERLTNLHELPATGFKVCCFPIKVKKGASGTTRSVAIFDE